jgi:hypothetical protein
MPEGWNEFFAALDAASIEEVLFELALGMTPEWCMYAHWIGPEPEVCVVPLEAAWAVVDGDQLTLRDGSVFALA